MLVITIQKHAYSCCWIGLFLIYETVNRFFFKIEQHINIQLNLDIILHVYIYMHLFPNHGVVE